LGNIQLINEDEKPIAIPNRQQHGEFFTNSYDCTLLSLSGGIDYNVPHSKRLAAF